MEKIEDIFNYLSERFEDLELVIADLGDSWITVPSSKIYETAKFLRDDPQLRFNTLMCLSGVHYPKEDALGVTYHLHSTNSGNTLVLKVEVPIDKPVVPSIESIWKTANWHEREAWDLLGIRFEGHPNHRRILCPSDWEGHALRKDYKQQKTYRNITTGI